jgi:uncharacterized protein (DUF952 family)
MALIYHLTAKQAWQASQDCGLYASPALAEEGFIHCCEERQKLDIRRRYFADTKDLLCLTIETLKLTSPLIYDWSPSLEDTFPHIYGPINTDAVISVDKI